MSESATNEPSGPRIETSAEMRESRAGDGLHTQLWFWAPPVFLGLASLLIASLAMLQTGDATNVVAIFPPSWSAERSVIAASSVGPVLGSGAFPFMVAVKGEARNYEEKLRTAGAILVVDGKRFPFCGTKP